ncbi:hypothetical protein DRN02_005065 [Sphingomonas paucimobilis]|uniref:hypothetical protein n=1 Tax=Sphingomonas paucimobilis TaxID=13689 RepID=UPI000DE2102C|nr:hypothetical protein [Sphingomonas paucimobilis]QBE91461.1 hypothetical protein DRN02_005065 [Sphingomonas paucimobilis]
MADIPESTKSEHVSWTVNATSYLRNLDSEDLDAETIAVHYQKAPEKTETGTRISLCFPTLIVSGYCSEPREVADRVARILNAHWDEPAAPPAMDREAAYRQALEDVCNPLGYLQRMADAEGAKLSGMAYAIASDIGTIQRIAKEALSTLSADAIRQGEGERGFCNKCGFVGVPQKGGFHYRPKDGQPCNYICPVSATPASHASDGGKA